MIQMMIKNLSSHYLWAEDHAAGEEAQHREEEDPPLLPSIWAAVHRLGDGADHRLDEGELRAEAQCAEHGEEENGPEAADRHAADCLGVGDEGEAGALRHHVLHLGVHLVRHEADDAEDDEAGEDGGEAVADANVEGVSAKSG